jgi:hypothetical protein
VLPEAGHGVADAGFDGVGELGHQGQGLDVASSDPARARMPSGSAARTRRTPGSRQPPASG